MSQPHDLLRCCEEGNYLSVLEVWVNHHSLQLSALVRDRTLGDRASADSIYLRREEFERLLAFVQAYLPDWLSSLPH